MWTVLAPVDLFDRLVRKKNRSSECNGMVSQKHYCTLCMFHICFGLLGSKHYIQQYSILGVPRPLPQEHQSEGLPATNNNWYGSYNAF